jgi:hypothetical protein
MGTGDARLFLLAALAGPVDDVEGLAGGEVEELQGVRVRVGVGGVVEDEGFQAFDVVAKEMGEGFALEAEPHVADAPVLEGTLDGVVVGLAVLFFQVKVKALAQVVQLFG